MRRLRAIVLAMVLLAAFAAAFAVTGPLSPPREGSVPSSTTSEPERERHATERPEPSPAPPSRAEVTPEPSMAAVPPRVRDTLERHGESVTDYEALLRHQEETARIVRRLPAHRMFEALQKHRFSAGAFVRNELAPRFGLDERGISEAIVVLKPIADEMVDWRDVEWRERVPPIGTDASIVLQLERDRQVRRVWLDMDEAFGPRWREADRRLRGLLRGAQLLLPP